ncbi:auxin-responsive protein SAUR32-like [Impatiens glandulifera]|uniref:auxin-responsive protein SAUR32-like n=1 Tax=Impatiens glandulifera TaxID=253017 RepID=UPI001FB1239B|nr:auxin-responsive protein SAUR32-like [Impatiens glandulifera]
MQFKDQKKLKVKKGWLAVRVGLDDETQQRFMIPISYLYHSLFQKLLDRAHELYGYHTTGPIHLPCSVQDFHHLRWRIENDTAGSDGHNHQSHYLAGSIAFHPC